MIVTVTMPIVGPHASLMDLRATYHYEKWYASGVIRWLMGLVSCH